MKRPPLGFRRLGHVVSLVALGFLLFWFAASARAADRAAQPNKPAISPRVLLAGAATSNITPPLGELIVGGWIPHESVHVHDELHARCLVLDNGRMRLAIVVSDNVGIPREVFDAAKQSIHEETGIPVEHLLMSSDHTHSATTARGEKRMVASETLSDYQQFLARRISDGVRRAINNLEPARIGWGSASEPSQVFNRRWRMKTPVPNPFGGTDPVKMNPGRQSPELVEPAGPVDPEIAFISVQSIDGRPIALVANYSLHYVGGVPRGTISADYFAVFADRIQQLLGADRLDPPFVGIMSNGTSGDVNNINFRGAAERLQPFEKIRQVADLVARDVFEAHKNIKFHDWVELGAVQQELTLGVRKPTAEQLAYFRKVLEKPDDAKPYHVHEKTYAQRVSQLNESPDNVSVILQTFRIGDVGIAAIPFKVFAEIGLEIKEKCPLPKAFTISLANGSYGYLPTPRQHALGGYETWMGTNNVQIDASTKIVKTLLGMFDRLK